MKTGIGLDIDLRLHRLGFGRYRDDMTDQDKRHTIYVFGMEDYAYDRMTYREAVELCEHYETKTKG